MDNNFILKKIRYALDLNDFKLIDIFKLGGLNLTRDDVCSLCTKDSEDNYQTCDNQTLETFLNGLIIYRRGSQDSGEERTKDIPLDNNQILRKLRIAMNYKDSDMLAVLKLDGMEFSKNQLSALFRAKDNHHYQPCKDQLLRKFLQGLVKKYRENKQNRPSAILDFDNF
ncbi:DUF1456 family protein [bacterium]|nr:DUF1456 family protein [bacterium]